MNSVFVSTVGDVMCQRNNSRGFEHGSIFGHRSFSAPISRILTLTLTLTLVRLGQPTKK